MKYFGIVTPHAFLPPRPGARVGDEAKPAHRYTTPDDMVKAYLGTTHFSGAGNCGRFMQSLRKCFSSNATGNPDNACMHYIEGLKRSC